MKTEITSYFAASNSYGGFISYFDTVFNPKKYEMIYVIKGGPGTGKSSFMKKIAENAEKDGLKTEKIFCSSDPNSLDGVIVKSKEKQIALLDGTAPHERDAKYPGAYDCIINLGENWDSRWLEGNKEKISELVDAKSKSYKAAYHYLDVCGTCDKRISSSINQDYLDAIADSEIKNMLEYEHKTPADKSNHKLICSFGRYGKYSLANQNGLNHIALTPSCDYFTAKLLLKSLARKLQEKGINIQLFLDPLDSNSPDTIYIPTEEKIYSLSFGTPFDISLPSSKASGEESLRISKKVYEESISEAERWFSIASDLHFRLEEIYSQAMNFEKNDILLGKKYKEIMTLLS